MGEALIEAAVSQFWLVSEQLITLVVPIIGIIIIFKLIYEALLKER